MAVMRTPGASFFSCLHDVPVAVGVDTEDLVVEGAVPAIVHPEHDGDNGGLIGDDVAREPYIDAAAAAASDPIATPAGMDEGDVESAESVSRHRFRQR